MTSLIYCQSFFSKIAKVTVITIVHYGSNITLFIRNEMTKRNYQKKEEPIVKPVDLPGLDLSQEDVLEGAGALDPVGPGV